MNKEELNQEIGKLKASLEAHESQVKDLQQDLQAAEKKLADSNKPQLTVKQFGDIEDAICRAIDNYNFDDYDQYEYEMSMEYDNKVYLSHIEFRDSSDLASEIYAKVEDLFGLADESDDTEAVPSE
jgi:chromosome segregation ATPase